MNDDEFYSYIRLKYPANELTKEYLDSLPDGVIDKLHEFLFGYSGRVHREQQYRSNIFQFYKFAAQYQLNICIKQSRELLIEYHTDYE